MCNRKGVGPRIEPWGIPALTAFFSRLLIQNHLKLSFTKKRRNRPNISPEIPQVIRLWKRPACQTLSKSLDISSARARVAPGLLKALAILSDTTVRRSVVDWEDLKPYWKS